MKKLLMLLFYSSFLFAQNFDEFLQQTLNNGVYLKSLQLDVDKSIIKGDILQRYENPTLELEYSKFSPDVGVKQNAKRVSISQSIRLWGVREDREDLAKILIQNEKLNLSLQKANYIYQLSSKFISYSKAKELFLLSKKELKISKKIYQISNERYKLGNISYDKLLEAKIDYESKKVSVKLQELNFKERYFELLGLASIRKKVKLNHNYNFKLNPNISLNNNFDLKLIEGVKKSALKELQLNSHKIQNIELKAELEKESEQDITRVGLAFPLAIFNSKKEERELAKIKAIKAKLTYSLYSKKIEFQIQKLKTKLKFLKQAIKEVKKSIRKEKKLFQIFEDGYKIAKINLIELQKIEQRYIKTQKTLIELKSKLNQSIITLNLIAGEHL